MADIKTHHMIYGDLIDFVTGETLVDTDDERIRQKINRFLVEKKGFQKEDLELRRKIETLFGGQFVVSQIDTVIMIRDRRLVVVRYGPGSLVTRERPALAAARVLDSDHIIPLVIVTNGEDAEILDTITGKVIGQGMDAFPNRQEILTLADDDPIPRPDAERREKELRILNAFDIEICCAGGPCALPDAPEG